MDVTNLQVGMIAHLQWKSKLSDFFYGVEDLTLADVPDHTVCDFGKLLYGGVIEEFGDFGEMNLLVRLHKEIHDDIKRLIQIPKEERKAATAKQALEDFKKKCDRLIALMERLEAMAKQK